jgi:hypothetical protein
VQAPTLSVTALVAECDTLLSQLPLTPARSNAIRQRDALQVRLDAAKATKTDFAEIVKLGRALKLLVAAGDLLPLSEADYLSLGNRHAELVQRVHATCAQLADADDYDALEVLSTKLDELHTLDLSVLMQSCDGDPTLPHPAVVEEESDMMCDPARPC